MKSVEFSVTITTVDAPMVTLLEKPAIPLMDGMEMEAFDDCTVTTMYSYAVSMP